MAERNPLKVARLSRTCGIAGLALGVSGYWLAAASLSGPSVVAPIGIVGSVLGGVPAILLGVLARIRIASSSEEAGGKGAALAGIVMGLLCLAFPFIIPR